MAGRSFVVRDCRLMPSDARNIIQVAEISPEVKGDAMILASLKGGFRALTERAAKTEKWLGHQSVGRALLLQVKVGDSILSTALYPSSTNASESSRA